MFIGFVIDKDGWIVMCGMDESNIRSMEDGYTLLFHGDKRYGCAFSLTFFMGMSRPEHFSPAAMAEVHKALDRNELVMGHIFSRKQFKMLRNGGSVEVCWSVMRMRVVFFYGETEADVAEIVRQTNLISKETRVFHLPGQLQDN